MIDVRRDYYCAFGNSIANCLRENKTIICSSREHQPQVTTIEVSYFAELITMQGIKILSLSLHFPLFLCCCCCLIRNSTFYRLWELTWVQCIYLLQVSILKYLTVYFTGMDFYYFLFPPEMDSRLNDREIAFLYLRRQPLMFESVLYFVIYEWHKD